LFDQDDRELKDQKTKYNKNIRQKPKRKNQVKSKHQGEPNQNKNTQDRKKKVK